MDRKGLLGGGLVSPIVLFIVAIILALFVMLSAGSLSLVKPAGEVGGQIESSTPLYYDPLLSTIPLDIYNTETNSYSIVAMRIMDIYMLPSNLQAKTESIVSGLSKLVDNEKSCLIFHGENLVGQGDSEAFSPLSAIYIRYTNGGAKQITGDAAISMYSYYYSHNLFQKEIIKRSDTGEQWRFVYYYGGCQDE